MGYCRCYQDERVMDSALGHGGFQPFEYVSLPIWVPFLRQPEYERCDSAAHTRAVAFCMSQTSHLMVFGVGFVFGDLRNGL